MTKFDIAIPMLRELRRTYSRILMEQLDNSLETEDTIRLIGHLQTAYDHVLAAKAKDGDMYCVLGKHLPAALILMGEIGDDVSPVYAIMSVLSDCKIEPCSSCKTDQNAPDDTRNILHDEIIENISPLKD